MRNDHFLWTRIIGLFLGAIVCAAHLPVSVAAADESAIRLNPQNTKVPFCYLVGGKRSWPILSRDLAEGEHITLTAKRGDAILGTGDAVSFEGLTISASPVGRLQVEEAFDEAAEAFELIVELRTTDEHTEQTLSLRPAPPPRPISYIADLVDDFIHTFYDANAHAFRTIDKADFDQYFRRLQAHGTRRLICWHSPFPYFTRPDDHDPADWKRYVGQSTAILESSELDKVMREQPNLPSWMWINFLMHIRLDPHIGEMFAQSAVEHEIALTASFRPFEAALTKYYEVPSFDTDGRFLWGFLPLAMPIVNYQPENVCFAHYREVLKQMGKVELGKLTTIELTGFTEGNKLLNAYGPTGGFEIYGSPFAPIANDAFVLQRTGDDETYALRKYSEVQPQAESHWLKLDGFQLVQEEGKDAKLVGINLPHELRFVILKHKQNVDIPVELDKEEPLRLRSAAGNLLHRETIYWIFDENTPEGLNSRIVGIEAKGEYRTAFQASVNSLQHLFDQPQRIPLTSDRGIVIDRGSLWNVEMIDFQRPAARTMAIAQMKALFALQGTPDPFASEEGVTPQPAFDELFVNTRSHVDLAPTYADGEDGIKTLAYYYKNRRFYRHHLGLDKAYAPISAANDSRLIAAIETSEGIKNITAWQTDEWRDSCQSLDSPFVWRLGRNLAVADGVTQLLHDFDNTFSGMRIRAVIPPREAAIERITTALDEMPVERGEGTYGRDYYHRLWCSNNHIPTIGEGMAMVDLTGTDIEPVFLGSGGYQPDMTPFAMFVDEQIDDISENRGSDYRGPRSYFLEAQFTLRAADREEARRHRERMICHLLSHSQDIREVLLYEATDWLHTLPLNDPDYCSHAFTATCGDE
ncbi:MAG: hypothetical protein O2955_03790 [Planctomycetota bacterium]|nr:hypothetical protein [Planctomycetota bacterium]MDA1211610.1 hypothetical protein [Planctomycetota bacterium]